MKYVSKIILVFAISLIFLSCDKSQILLNEKVEKNKELKSALLDKYGINVTETESGEINFKYPNGKNLLFKKIGEKYLVTGSLIYGREFGVKLLDSNNNSSAKVIFTDNTFNNRISQNQLAGLVKNISLGESYSSVRTFDNCFVEEWNAFCSDTVSCIAQIVAPLEVATAVAISCAFFE